jgi:sigma54-dependent transcription regulator
LLSKKIAFIYSDMKKRVVIGFVGTRLDAGASAERWKKWRPTVALTQEKDFFIDRLIRGNSPTC